MRTNWLVGYMNDAVIAQIPSPAAPSLQHTNSVSLSEMALLLEKRGVSGAEAYRPPKTGEQGSRGVSVAEE